MVRPYRWDEELPTFEFHCTAVDRVQGVLDAGCILQKVDEYGEAEDEPIHPDVHTLPTYVMIVGRKSDAEQATLNRLAE